MSKKPEFISYLEKRRSVMAQNLEEPSPRALELEKILEIGARVPDHGKLAPWYFLVFQGKQREIIGKKIRSLYHEQNPDAKEAHLDIEEGRFTRAPLVIGVVSRMKEGKPPQWEQILSSGAVCMNIVHAVYGLGYAAQWLTEWYAFDDAFKSYLRCDEKDHIAGFIHIGTPIEQPEERDRPKLSDIVTYWEEGCSPVKGDHYGKDGFGFSNAGFNFTKS